MGPLDALWHLLNFVAPALGLGLLASGMAKLLWRHELGAVAWGRLALWACGASLAALVAGLVLTGRDGTMVMYAGMVVACALALWWAGFMRRR